MFGNLGFLLLWQIDYCKSLTMTLQCMRNNANNTMKMKVSTISSMILAGFALVTSSCSSGPNARTGTAVGALGGAAAGGIIGHQSGNAAEGALIGAGVGAMTGNVIGGKKDNR
jgi:hypothetical protein